MFVIDVEPRVDERGSFARVYCEDEFREHGIDFTLKQSNLSTSNSKGTLRGLHYQIAPKLESKVVRCIQGAVFDVTVDMREDSPTYLSWCGYELRADNMRSLYIPGGIAHGFMTLQDDTKFFYMVSELYAPEHERGVRWDDPSVGIQWPLTPTVMSDKDKMWELI